jgi:hypothetical protein
MAKHEQPASLHVVALVEQLPNHHEVTGKIWGCFVENSFI